MMRFSLLSLSTILLLALGATAPAWGDDGVLSSPTDYNPFAGTALGGTADAGLTETDSDVRCLKYREPVIVVTPFTSDVIVNDRAYLAQISDIADNAASKAIKYVGGNPDTGRHSHVPVGLATAELVTDMRYDISMLNNLRGEACGQITNFRLNVGFRDNTIYVARELPRRSCSYKQVLAHEHRHIETDVRFLEGALPRIRQYMEEAVRDVGQVRGASRADIEHIINSKMNRRLAEMVNNMSRERAILQQNVDTPEEYRRVTYSCDGQMIDILKNRYGPNWLETLDRKQ